MNFMKRLLTPRTGAIAGLLLGLCGGMQAQIGYLSQVASYPMVGSWLGRAVPVAGTTLCPVGSAGCPIPKEIIMLFTINADGTMVAIDSNIFAGGNHTTAHGQWVSRSYGTVHATFSLLQSGATGIFIGGFKNLFDGTLSDANNMTGTVHAFLYSYTTATGAVIVGPDGLPSPNPLTNPAQCATTTPAGACAHLADFSFIAQRIQVEDLAGVD
jgi:hypothetical protein